MMNMHLCFRRSLLWFLGIGLGISLGAERAIADESKESKDPGGLPVAKLEREEPVDFDTEILPFLRKNCLACHNQTDAKGDLVLETTESIRAGIEGEAVLVPGKAEESLIFMVSSHREKPIMPPKRNKVGANPLSSEQLALLKLWIDQGATKGSGKAATKREWHPLPPGVHPIYAVAVSADGNYAACGRANQIFVYHVSTGRDLGRLTDPALLESGPYRRPGVAHLDNVQSLAFDATGSLLASGGYRNVKLWRRSFRPRGLVLDTKSPAARTTTAMASTADGARLATGSHAGGVYLWAIGDDGSVALERAFVGIHLRAVTALSFSANGMNTLRATNSVPSSSLRRRAWLASSRAAGRRRTVRPLCTSSN